MKIWNNKDLVQEAINDFIKANLDYFFKVGGRGKLVMEISESLIKGKYLYKDDGKKLKTISYSANDIVRR